MTDEQDANTPAEEGSSAADTPATDAAADAAADSGADAAEGSSPEGAGGDDAVSALAAAQAAISAIGSDAASAAGASPAQAPAPAQAQTEQAPPPPPPATMPFSAPDFTANDDEPLPEGLDLLSDVNVNVTIELGRTRMLVEDVLRLAEGAVVELDKLAGDPVDVFVNERLVARGEVLVLNDNFCIRVNEILDADTVEDD
ncbi:MAG: flagellar motor switch protein FliN [Planctomycetota bacterium]